MNYLDKPLLEIGGKTIIESILDTARPQVDRLIINVNSNPERYVHFNLPIICDESKFAGPLAGILATNNYVAANLPEVRWIACFPGDVPWFPGDIVAGMLKAIQETGGEVAWLRTAEQIQPLFSVWSVTLGRAVEEALRRGMYSPMQFILSRKHAVVNYPQLSPGFFNNINTPEDLQSARILSEKYRALRKSAM